jgi:hypothetical protein
MEYGKAMGGAFLVGGLLCLLCEIILVIFSNTPLYAAGFSALVSLLVMGVIGSILFIAGIYPKLEKFGGMGAVLPFSGLAAAVAGITVGVGKATGSVGKGAITAFIEIMTKVIWLGIAISMVIGAIYHFTGLEGTFTTPYAPAGVAVEMVGPPNGTAEGPPNGVPAGVDFMGFVWAFVIGGVLCALFQAVQMLTKIPPPIYLMVLLVLGALLTATGAMKFLVGLSGAGTLLLIFDAGEGTVATFSALLAGVPGPVPFISFILLFVILWVLGVIAGAIRLSMDKRAEASVEEA